MTATSRDPETMDQFTAHMDRAWDLVSTGDTRGARSSARHAQDLEPENPEVHNLLGYIAAADGDPDDALEHYRQAMALDDEYLEPMLNAAEVLVYPLGEFDEAIALCDEALEISLSPEEQVDALLLKFEAFLGKGDRAQAAGVLEDVPAGPFETGNHDFLIGRAHFDVGQLDRAGERLRRAVEADPHNADEREDFDEAVRHFTVVRELDRRSPRIPWSLPADEFRACVEAGLAALPAPLAARVQGATLYVSDAPGVEVVADGCDPRVPLLLDGIEGQAAARIFVYQRNVERSYYGADRMKDDLPKLVAREVEASFAEPTEPAAPAKAP